MSTPISDEARTAFKAAVWTDPEFGRVELEDSEIDAGLVAAAPLLVSAEAERDGEADEIIAELRAEVAALDTAVPSERRAEFVDATQRQMRKFVQMAEDRRQALAVVEGLRAELAERIGQVTELQDANIRLTRERDHWERGARRRDRILQRRAERAADPNTHAVELAKNAVIAHLPIDSAAAAHVLADDIIRSVTPVLAAGGREKPNRCESTHTRYGRCELTAGHAEPHVTDVGAAGQDDLGYSWPAAPVGGRAECTCHEGSAIRCPIHTQADFDAAELTRVGVGGQAEPSDAYVPKVGDEVDVHDRKFKESAIIAAISTEPDGATWVEFADGSGCALRRYRLVPVAAAVLGGQR